MEPVSATLAHALTDGDGNCRGKPGDARQWPPDGSGGRRNGPRRARRRERRQSAHDATVKEMQLIEQARLENEAAVERVRRPSNSTVGRSRAWEARCSVLLTV